jgi:hypothetical protein
MKKFLLAAASALALMLPASASANHSWNGWHWPNPSYPDPRTLTISDGVSGDWDTVFPAVRSDWNSALGGRMTLALGSAKKVDITTASRSFGNNGWLGIAQVWLKGSHITRASVKLNDFYFNFDPTIDTLPAKQQVFCQEVGHTLGLDHQDADSCMNDQNDLATSPFPSPNAHDAEELALIYDHRDAASRRGGHERGPYTVHTVPVP